MDDRSDNNQRLVTVGRSPDPDLQNEAFRLWIENGRSARIVASAIGCDKRTIERWAKSEQWEQRRIEQAQSFLPGAKAETAFALKLAAHNAAIRLQQISFDAFERGTAPNLKEVQALTLIIDRGGYSPTGTRSPTDVNDPMSGAKDDLPDFSQMTPQQLRTWEDAQRRRAKRIG